MKKRCICAFVCACILFSVCVLPSFASEDRVFRVAVTVDDEALEGFADSQGILYEFVSSMDENAVFAAFYFDAEDIVESEDLTAALVYLKVNGLRIGILSSDIHAAQRFNVLLKYVTKSASRFILCENGGTQGFLDAGYSVLSEFDVIFSSVSEAKIAPAQQGNTFVLFKLSEKSFSDLERLVEFSVKNGFEFRPAV